MTARRLLGALALAGVAALWGATPALGHAGLVQSSPGPGELLPEPPTELRLSFSEPIEAGYTSLDLIGADGATLLERAGQPDPADGLTLLVSDLPSLPDGAYTIIWRTLSASDGHTAQGFLIFGVGDAELPSGVAGGQGLRRGELHPGHSALVVAFDDLGRSLTYGGLMLAFGLAIIGFLVLRPALGAVPFWVVFIQAASLAAAAAGAAVTILVNSSGVGGVRGGTFDVVAYLLESRTGTLLAGRVVLAVIGFAGVLFLWSRRPLAALLLGGSVGGLGIVLAVMAGHAAGYEAMAPVGAAAVHVMAAGIWVSGLAALAIIALTPASRVARMSAAVPRFSALALVSIGLVAITGSYNAWLSTRDLPSLETPYQVILALKLALVAGALSLGLLNYLDGGKSAASASGIRRRVLIEAGLAVLIIVATANLTAGSPPAEGRPVAIQEAAGSGVGGAAFLALLPGGPGVNTVQVDLAEVPVEGATVELALQRLDQGIGTGRLPLLAVDQFGNVQEGHAGHGEGTATALARHVARGAQLPANSRWDASVVVSDPLGGDLLRRRFVFTMGPNGVTQGRQLPIVDPVILVAIALLGGGLLALAYRLSGGHLPLTNESTSGFALVAGAGVSLVLGVIVLLAGPAL